MNSNSLVLYHLYGELHKKLQKEQYVTDKTGKRLVQLRGVSFQLYPEQGHHIKVFNKQTGSVFRETNEQYVTKQTAWHESKELNIQMVKDVKIWQYCSGDNGQINSNYGWCVYHPDNIS